MDENNNFSGNSYSHYSFFNPHKILEDIGIFGEGATVADFGCGAGYFSLPLAKLAGETGKIYAIDVLPSAIEIVASKAESEGLINIKTIRANLEIPQGSTIEEKSVDAVLLANILYQSQTGKMEILKEAQRILKDAGKMVVIGWIPGKTQMGPAENLRISSEMVRKDAVSLGFKLNKIFDIDPYHYCLIFNKH